jgi:hypothetical protein
MIMLAGIRRIGLASLVWLIATVDVFAYFDGNFDIQRHFLPKEENLFDWKAYQLPLSWQRRWHAAKNGFQATAGSLSQELFYFKHHIKLQGDLHKYFSLLYTQEREAFYKSEPIYQQIEARFGHRYHVSVLGFPYYEKKYDNLGLAISYNEPYSMRHVKLTWLNQLATYNDKNQEDDRNEVTDDLDRNPVLIKLDTRYRLFNKIDLYLDLQQELESVMLDQSDGLEKSYHGHHYRGALHWHLNAGWLLGFAFKKRLEARTHCSQTSDGQELADQEIHHHYLDFFGNASFESDEITFGYLYGEFKNTVDALDPNQIYRMRLNSHQMYAKWQNGLNHWMKMFYSLQAGLYDYTRTGDDDDNGYKLKAGLGVIFFKTDRINFLVLTSWAVDSISEGQWDGGNMQLQLLF